jgi:tetratricopeptide (TPR) repeat protein
LTYATSADAENKHGRESAALREQSIEAFLAARRLDERNPRVWGALGIAYFGRASTPGAADVEGDLALAEEALKKAQALNPHYLAAYFPAGQASALRANRAQARGDDPRPALTEALAQYEKGRAINPAIVAFPWGIGVAHLAWAQDDWDSGRDPFPTLERAREAFEEVLALEATQGQSALGLAEATAREARYRAGRGEDPRGPSAKALEQYRVAVKLMEGNSIPWSNRGLALIVLAEYELEHRLDPSAHLAAAMDAAKNARLLNSSDESLWRVLASAKRLEVRGSLRRGSSVPEAYAAAAEIYDQGLKEVPEPWELRAEYLQLCLEWAEALSKARKDSTGPLKQARFLADQLVEARPRWAEARAYRAWVLALEAEQAPQEDRPSTWRQALDELRAALRDNPNLVAAWRVREESLAGRL